MNIISHVLLDLFTYKHSHFLNYLSIDEKKKEETSKIICNLTSFLFFHYVNLLNLLAFENSSEVFFSN